MYPLLNRRDIPFVVSEGNVPKCGRLVRRPTTITALISRDIAVVPAIAISPRMRWDARQGSRIPTVSKGACQRLRAGICDVANRVA